MLYCCGAALFVYIACLVDISTHLSSLFSLAAWGQSRFIREYAGYLEEKCDALKVIGKSVELLPAKVIAS
jgi:hypothetical protein